MLNKTSFRSQERAQTFHLYFLSSDRIEESEECLDLNATVHCLTLNPVHGCLAIKPGVGRGYVLPYVSYIGMCLTKGMVLEPLWSETVLWILTILV